MKLFLKNKKYKNENYICNVWIDGREAESYDLNRKEQLVVDVPEGRNVKIEIQNMFFKSDKKAFLMFLYWVLSVLTGSGERMPFGKPFNALLKIENVNKENIYIQTNSIRKKEAFEIKTECKVVENRFVSPKGYKASWFWGYVLPIFILLSAILLVVLLVEFQEKFYAIKGIFLAIIAICEIGWIAYAGFILKK